MTESAFKTPPGNAPDVLFQQPFDYEARAVVFLLQQDDEATVTLRRRFGALWIVERERGWFEGCGWEIGECRQLLTREGAWFTPIVATGDHVFSTREAAVETFALSLEKK